MAYFITDSTGHPSTGPTIAWDEYEALSARIRELEGQNAGLQAQRDGAQRALTKVMEQFREDRGWWDERDERKTEMIVTMLDLHPDLRTAPEVCAVLAKEKGQ